MGGNALIVYRRCGCQGAERSCLRLAEPRHGSWYFAVQVVGASGRRERVRKGGFASAEEAEQAGEQLIAADREGAVGATCTVAQWLRAWLGSDQSIRPRTRQGYADHVRLHLVPGLGRVRLAELSSRNVRQLFSALARRRNRYGRPLSPSTLQRIHATLRAALNAAVREGLLTSNPARHLRLPRPRRPHAVVWSQRRVAAWQADGQRPAVAVWTTQQLRAFLAFVHGDALFALWWLAALRGLRRGELAGLRWVEVNLEAAELTVAQQLIQHGGQIRVVPPKSAASQRTVALDGETVRLLLEHERRQAEQQQRCGSEWNADGYVFVRGDGRPIAPDYLTQRFRQLVLASRLPPVRLHDLRHGAASTALAAQVDLRTVQGQLGHASIVLTADTYTSVLPELYHEAAEATARLVLTTARTTARKVRRIRLPQT
ncbi:site-specific integrase [Nonomuraea sp. PA05]|uniref:tyrosine-type recombinase/integrase n=1 Tax=Nonomuraea sp. PA05 TaxID=2604466 RepID=UPI0011DADC2D|nr:tyrosine-type recombinase/integrase [Nonomuraea sp. PA05]TYB54731.1 site-specific integrase [Nonomuraea sp. PA05]